MIFDVRSRKEHGFKSSEYGDYSRFPGRVSGVFDDPDVASFMNFFKNLKLLKSCTENLIG